MTEDSELLRRFARDASEAAFTEIVNRHIEFVYATALRQLGGAAHRADDVTQAVFVDLARKAATLADRNEIVGWLHTSTRYAVAKLKRAEARRQKYEQEAQTMHATDADEPAEWERLRPVLDDALHDLREADRDAILMRFFQNRRLADIGQRLGLTEAAARMRVERALEKLRAALASRGITSTAAALGLALANQPVVAVPAGLAAQVITGAVADGVALPVATAVLFMKAKTIIAAASVVAAIGLAGYELNQARETRELAAGASRERDALQTQVRQLRQRVATVEQEKAALEEKLHVANTIKTTVFSAPEAARPLTSIPTAAGGFWTLGPSPADPAEARRQMRENNGRNIDRAYAALYQQLNLTPEQREQLKNLMLDVQEKNADLFKKAVAAAKAKNPQLERADMYEIAQATNAEIQQEQQASVREAMGPAVGDAFVHYQQTSSLRGVTDQLAGALFNSDSPLTPGQANQLVDVLAQHAVDDGGKVDLSALNTEAAIADIQARGVLNERQIDALRQAAANAQRQRKAEREWNMAPMASVRAAIYGTATSTPIGGK